MVEDGGMAGFSGLATPGGVPVPQRSTSLEIRENQLSVDAFKALDEVVIFFGIQSQADLDVSIVLRDPLQRNPPPAEFAREKLITAGE